MTWGPRGICRRRLEKYRKTAFILIGRTRFRSPAILYMALGIERDTMTIDEIRDNFALLDEWDDRYRYVIELGRTLDPMPEAEHSTANKVQGCASQVWLSKQLDRSHGREPPLNYLGDSDAHIVRGLIAILL